MVLGLALQSSKLCLAQRDFSVQFTTFITHSPHSEQGQDTLVDNSNDLHYNFVFIVPTIPVKLGEMSLTRYSRP